MAKIGATPKATVDEPGQEEPPVNYLSDAPAERSYADAVSDDQRALLLAAGIPVAEASPAA